jgi:hypothetical protein
LVVFTARFGLGRQTGIPAVRSVCWPFADLPEPDFRAPSNAVANYIAFKKFPNRATFPTH